MTFKKIQFEINGSCNAKCRFCVTGYNQKIKSSYIAPQDFCNALDYLEHNNWIDKSTSILLYNYGEPFLHPQFDKIIKILDKKGYTFELSTNGSIEINWEKDICFNNMKVIRFSMPGFSEESYKRSNGLSFNRTINNIQKIVNYLKEHEYRGEIIVKYLIYQFNIDEISKAVDFAKEIGAFLYPIHAIIGDLGQQISYLNCSMSPFELQKVSKNLLFYYVDELLEKCPSDYKCEYAEELVIDENLNVLPCCMITKKMENYSIGNLYEIQKNDIHEYYTSSEFCTVCKNSGAPYVLSNAPNGEYYLGLNADEVSLLKQKKVFLLGNDGITNTFLNKYSDIIICEKFESLENCLNKRKHNELILLATHRFRLVVKQLKEMGLIYKKDYLIYNVEIK